MPDFEMGKIFDDWRRYSDLPLIFGPKPNDATMPHQKDQFEILWTWLLVILGS